MWGKVDKDIIPAHLVMSIYYHSNKTSLVYNLAATPDACPRLVSFFVFFNISMDYLPDVLHRKTYQKAVEGLATELSELFVARKAAGAPIPCLVVQLFQHMPYHRPSLDDETLKLLQAWRSLYAPLGNLTGEFEYGEPWVRTVIRPASRVHNWCPPDDIYGAFEAEMKTAKSCVQTH